MTVQRATYGLASVLAAVFLASGLSACWSAAPGPAAATDRDSLAAAMRASLRAELLAPWYPRAVDTTYGGFLSDFAYDWTPEGPQDKFVVTQARHVWTTSKAAAFFPEERDAYLAMAAQGVDFLREHMWDDAQGGFVSLVTRDGTLKPGRDAFTGGKTAYGNAFAIYALAAYHAASGDTAALGLAQRAFRWLDAHAHDAQHGGYFQFIGPDGAPLVEGAFDNPPKDQNSSIHLLEAFTELYHVWPDPVVRDRLQELLVLIRDTLTAEEGYLRLFFTADWTPVSYRDSSAAVRQANLAFDHVSFGHDVETAFLMLEAAHALGLDEEATLIAGKRMVDHALAYGWDTENAGFFDGAYYFDPAGPPEIVMEGKNWWAQAEGLNTLLLLADRYPDDEHRYYDRFRELWSYVQQYLIDHEHGGWYPGGLDREPEFRTAPKGSIWKAAYHDGRALMNVITRLENDIDP